MNVNHSCPAGEARGTKLASRSHLSSIDMSSWNPVVKTWNQSSGSNVLMENKFRQILLEKGLVKDRLDICGISAGKVIGVRLQRAVWIVIHSTGRPVDVMHCWLQWFYRFYHFQVVFITSIHWWMEVMQVDSLAHLAEGCIFVALMLFCRAVILASWCESPPSPNLVVFVRKWS